MTDEVAQPDHLRVRVRRAMQVEVSEVAIDLFLRQGFDATTTEQVATAAGVSTRSLFRYFQTKEDIVLDHVVDPGEWLQAALIEQPVSVAPWDALRAALGSLAQTPDYAPARLLTVSRLILSTPSLRARQLEKQNGWIGPLELELRKHLAPLPDGKSPDIRARAIISSALACLQVATEAWVASDGTSELMSLFDQAMGAIRELDR